MKFRIGKYFTCFLIVSVHVTEASFAFKGFQKLFLNYKEKESQDMKNSTKEGLEKVAKKGLEESTKEKLVYDSFKKVSEGFGQLFPLIREDMMKNSQNEKIIKDERSLEQTLKTSEEVTGRKTFVKRWSLYDIFAELNVTVIKGFIKLVISSVLGTLIYNFTKILDYAWNYFELPQLGGDFHFFRLLDITVPFQEVFL